MSRLGFPLGVTLVCGASGWIIAALQPSVEIALVWAIALVCLLPVAHRYSRRKLDIFEPIVIANIALTVMYVGRPAAIIHSKTPDFFKSYDISGRIREALIIALVGSLAMQVGYALPWAERTAARLPNATGTWDVETTLAFSIGLVVTACMLFGIFLLKAGGMTVLVGLLKGRSFTQDAYFRNSSAYLYGSPALLWPASLLLFAMGLAERRRGFIVASFLLMIPLAIFAGGQGSRITLIPLLLAPGIYFYLQRQRRPRPLAIALVAYLTFTVGIAYFRQTRSASVQVNRVSELKRSIEHPGYEYSQLLLHGTDNDMFESLAAETIVVPSKLKASPIDFWYRTAAKPIPSKIWKAKPIAPEEVLTATLFPQERARASSSAGVIGSWFLMWLVPGVIAGMVVVGYLFRIPFEYWRRYPDASMTQLILTASLMFIPILLRGGVGDTLARTLFGLAPIAIAARICRKAPPVPVAQASHQLGPAPARGS